MKLKFLTINIKTPSKSTDIIGGFSRLSRSSSSSVDSVASFTEFLAESPSLYRYKEIADATGNFTSGRLGKSSVWKCVVRGKTVIVTVKSQKRKTEDFRSWLREFFTAHHSSIIKFLGACCNGEKIYLVYEYVRGSSLRDCLRSNKAPGFTVLSSWISRMQIAVDLAQGLEYMHRHININYVHNYIKSSSILVTDPNYRARICYLGASFLAGEYEAGDIFETQEDSNSNIRAGAMHRRSRSLTICGTHGYMAPEYLAGGVVSQKMDVFAFGVVMLELLSGREPVRYGVEEGSPRVKRVGLIETLNIILCETGDNCTGRLRSWMDPRLRDSFPVDCAERVARIASSCVDPDPGQRPDMAYVASELSKLFIMSEQWSERMEANRGWVRPANVGMKDLHLQQFLNFWINDPRTMSREPSAIQSSTSSTQSRNFIDGLLPQRLSRAVYGHNERPHIWRPPNIPNVSYFDDFPVMP